MKYTIEFYKINKYEDYNTFDLECIKDLKQKELNTLLENCGFDMPPFILGEISKLKIEISQINEILNK